MNTTQGAVTFLFTDVEGSTRRWEDAPEQMRAALQLHDETLRSAFDRCGGEVFATGGDGFAVAFADPSDAIAAATHAQQTLADAPWPDAMRLHVRMGMHTGPAEARGGDFFGPTLNRAARLMAAGHGDQILVSEATRALLGAEQADLVDLGRHRLKDITDPQRIYQYGQRRFDALRTIGEEMGNLPRERTSFIGRDVLIEEITAALTAGSLVTLVGVGGVGKTRTALRVARRFAATAPDGAWWCGLSDAQTPGDSLDVIASALGVHPDPGDDPLDAVARWLRARSVLLVLDNCEHVLDAVAEFAEEVLDQAPDTLLLATSREGLAVAGERLFAVPSLVASDTDSESVELFVARACDVRADFDPSDARDEIGEICRRLDGIPLAIELAAARVDALSPRDILDHLDRRFELLTGGRGRRRERHQTLRQAVQWSYDQLDDTEQAVFRRLSVFAGDFELAAAVSVGQSFEMNDLTMVDALGSLCRKSLIEADPTSSGQRYRYLETVRAFAEEANEDAGELDAAMRAMTTWFTTWADALVALVTDCKLNEIRDLVELEDTNLRRMLGWAAQHGDTASIGRFFASMGRFPFWGGDALSALAADFADTPGLDDEPDADSVFSLAAIPAYEELDYAACVALTDRGLANAALHGRPGRGCRMVRWFVDLLLAGDDTSVSWLIEARDLARVQDDPMEELYIEFAVVSHHILTGETDYFDDTAPALRSRVESTGFAMLEMAFELWTGWREMSRDLEMAKVHLLRAAEHQGPGHSFFGNVAQQQIAAVAVLSADDTTAVRVGGSLARLGHDGGRSNWVSLGAVALTGPFVRAGDAAFAAELLGFVSTLTLLDNIWVDERAHATRRVRDALSAEDFARRFERGRSLTVDDVSGRLVSRLSAVEALVDGTPRVT